MFDEELVRNQDDELNLRITLSGGKIWQSKEIRSWYYPRPSLRSLFLTVAPVWILESPGLQKHRIAIIFRELSARLISWCLASSVGAVRN